MSLEGTKQQVCGAFSRRLDDPTSGVASPGGYTWGRQNSCRVQFLLVLRPGVNHQRATNWCSARGCASDRCGYLSRCALHCV